MDLEKEILMEEGMDLRFFFLRVIRKIWIVFVAALTGAAICAGGYKLYQHLNPQEREYRAETKYYIDFAEDSTGIGYGYYNDYTWNDWMKSDAILMYTMELLAATNITKEEVEEAVVADIISDVRLLTITVTAPFAERADMIAEATAKSLEHFPETIKEIDAIRIIRNDSAKEVYVGEKVKNLCIFGAWAGALTALFVLCLMVCMDVAVYLPAEIEKKFRLPVLGVFYAEGKTKPGEEEEEEEEFLSNASYLLREKRKIVFVGLGEQIIENKITSVLKKELQADVSVDAFAKGNVPAYEKLRSADAVVVCFACGRTNANNAARFLSDLEKQDIKITCAIIYNADRKLYHGYFGKQS